MMTWQLVATIGAVAVVIQCICSINQMSRHTNNVIRGFYIALVVTAFGSVLNPLYGAPPASWSDAAMLVLMAVLLRVNRRKSYRIGRGDE